MKKRVPIAVVMIALNEAHNMRDVLQNIHGWAQEIFLVDSCSSDATVDIALEFGVHVVQRKFSGFGDQWNFALAKLPIKALWTMKLDPDERLTDELKASIEEMIQNKDIAGIFLHRRLWFMGKILPVQQSILRVWRTGKCKFTEVAVNEYPIVDGKIGHAVGILEHHDSPNLDHWISKQNTYTTAEAVSQFSGHAVAIPPKIFGNEVERRMWLKRKFWHFPGRYAILLFYHLFVIGAWKAGKIGYIWARLRVEVYRMWEYKKLEMDLKGKVFEKAATKIGLPDSRVAFYE